MSFNNAIYDYSGKVLGFRCDKCDEIKTKMWGSICNSCRDRQSQNTQIKEFRTTITELKKELDLLRKQK